MTFRPKPIARQCVPLALQKAERYRVINDPTSAESICLDVLTVDPENQQALITLLLAITDQFTEAPTTGDVARAREIVPRLKDAYKEAYYTGIIFERCAKAQLRSTALGSGETAYEWLQEAMRWYEQAESQRPVGNDEAILRWNTCVRMLARNEHLRPHQEEPISLGSE